MATENDQANVANKPNARRFSLDTWAVLLALALSLLIRFGIFKHIPW